MSALSAVDRYGMVQDGVTRLSLSSCQPLAKSRARLQVNQTYNLYHPPLMAGTKCPRELGLSTHSIPPGWVSRCEATRVRWSEELTGGGSTKPPLGKGNRMKTVKMVLLDSAFVVMLTVIKDGGRSGA